MVQANRALGETVKIVYEPDWAESETIYKAVEVCISSRFVCGLITEHRPDVHGCAREAGEAGRRAAAVVCTALPRHQGA